MSRIVFISPYRDLSNLAQSVAEEIGITVEFYDGWLEQAGELIRALKGPAIDIIMSRGGTAEYLHKNFDIPVVRVNMGMFDILECLNEARSYCNNIVVTIFNEPLVGKSLLETTFGVSITEVIFNSLPELEQKIATLALSGNIALSEGVLLFLTPLNMDSPVSFYVLAVQPWRRLFSKQIKWQRFAGKKREKGSDYRPF